MLLIGSIYACVTLLLRLGVQRQSLPAKSAVETEPFVSVLIAARNEESNLADLFASLKNLQYPRDAFEIIFVDDNSTDRTRELAQEQLAELDNLVIITPAEKSPELNGKANALFHAMKLAQGEFIFITDADCSVPPRWIRQHLRYYEAGTAMVGGVTTLQNLPQNPRYFYHLQAQDWLYLLCTGCATAAWGLPFSIVGNNLSCRRSAYNRTGGFAQLGRTVVEDYALMRAFQKNGLPIKMVADPAMVVNSKPARGLNEFLMQRKRWAAGAKTMGILAKVLLIVGYSSKIVPVVYLLSGEMVLAWYFF